MKFIEINLQENCECERARDIEDFLQRVLPFHLKKYEHSPFSELTANQVENHINWLWLDFISYTDTQYIIAPGCFVNGFNVFLLNNEFGRRLVYQWKTSFFLPVAPWSEELPPEDEYIALGTHEQWLLYLIKRPFPIFIMRYGPGKAYSKFSAALEPKSTPGGYSNFSSVCKPLPTPDELILISECERRAALINALAGFRSLSSSGSLGVPVPFKKYPVNIVSQVNI